MRTTMGHHGAAHAPDAATRRRLERRIDDVGWGIFLVMTGALWMFARLAPSGTWLVATGVLLLAVDAVRWARGLPTHFVLLVLGILALGAGLADFLNVQMPLLAIAFVVMGLVLVFRPLIRRDAPRAPRPR